MSPYIKGLKAYKYLSSIKTIMSEKIDEAKYLHYLNIRNPRNIYLIGTPMHSNIGDNAIAFAEVDFLESCGFNNKNIKEITVKEYCKYKSRFLKKMNKRKNVVCMHGGGNMGNQWLIEELFRREVMKDLCSNPMIIFPQTFFYSGDEEGKTELQKSKLYYNGRKNLTIAAREETSYRLMKKSYPLTNVMLTPDIVFSLYPEKLHIGFEDRKGVLFVLRADGERILSDEDEHYLFMVVSQRYSEFRITDMYTELPVEKTKRKALIVSKLNEFAKVKLVITDRLHAMIFCALSETPCVVLRNNNHKIESTYKWISNLDYIQFADDVNMIEEMIKKIDKIENCRYPAAEMNSYFSDFRRVIRLYSKRARK